MVPDSIVSHGGGDILVPENLLQGQHVAAVSEIISCEGVPKRLGA